MVVPVRLLFLAMRNDREGALAKLALTLYRDAAWDEIRWEIHDDYRIRLRVGEVFVSFRRWERLFGGKRDTWSRLVREVTARMGWTVTTCLAGDDRVERDGQGHTPKAYPPAETGHTLGRSKRPLGTIVRIPYYEDLSRIEPAFRRGLIEQYAGHTHGTAQGRRSAPLPTPSSSSPSPQKPQGTGVRKPWKDGKPSRKPAEVNAEANQMRRAFEEEEYQEALEIRDMMQADRERAEEREAREARVREIRIAGQQRARARRQGDSSEVERLDSILDRLFASETQGSGERHPEG